MPSDNIDQQIEHNGVWEDLIDLVAHHRLNNLLEHMSEVESEPVSNMNNSAHEPPYVSDVILFIQEQILLDLEQLIKNKPLSLAGFESPAPAA